jgi:hypothetical protein
LNSLALVLRSRAAQASVRSLRRLGGDARRLEARGVPAADTLASTCPAETALTPAGRMRVMRARLAAVKAATAAIRPAHARFYEVLDEGRR